MRTLVDIPEADLQILNHLSKSQKVSRAELVRNAISTYVEPHRPQSEVDCFGIWADNPVDGLEYQRKLRSEWDD